MHDNLKTCQGEKNQQIAGKTDRQITVNNQWLHIVYYESFLLSDRDAIVQLNSLEAFRSSLKLSHKQTW